MLIENIGQMAMYEQTAEECCELAQALLKMSRLMRNENPPFKYPMDIVDNLYEETADVLICLDELQLLENDIVNNWIQVKRERMEERLKKLAKMKAQESEEAESKEQSEGIRRIK